jgi:transposase
MPPYSTDLRERIVSAVERGKGSLRQLADLFLVSLSTIVRLLRHHRTSGSLRPKPHAGGRRPLLDDEACQRLRDLVAAQPDATLDELRQRLGIPCGLSTLCRTLQRLGLSRKKKSLHADEQDTPAVQAERAAFEERLATVDPAHLVFVDEMGATTAMTRTYGRAPIGERVVGSAPGKWDNVTLIAGLRSTGVVAPFAFAGATDQEAFQTYVEQVLVPALQPGDVVVWDNLQPHKNSAVVAAVAAAQARVEPLPAYSPDETPIEELFSKAKTYLRKVAARSVDAVIPALGAALNLVTPKDCLGWFHDRAAYAYAFH